MLAELIAHPAEQVILAEVLALRMLYLNTVQILGRGRELGTEDLKKLIEGAGPPFPAYFYDEVAPPSALFGGWVPAAPPALPMILSAGLPGAPGPIPTTISDVWAGGPCFPRHYSQGAPGSRPFFGR